VKLVDPEEPNLVNLMARLRQRPASERNKMKFIYAQVASGQRDPITQPLMRDTQVLACQAMVILLKEAGE